VPDEGRHNCRVIPGFMTLHSGGGGGGGGVSEGFGDLRRLIGNLNRKRGWGLNDLG